MVQRRWKTVGMALLALSASRCHRQSEDKVEPTPQEPAEPARGPVPNECVLPTDPVLSLPPGTSVRTFTDPELRALADHIAQDLVPAIEERGGHVILPSHDAPFPTLLAGLPPGTYTNPDAASYRALAQALATANQLPMDILGSGPDCGGCPGRKELKKRHPIIADLGAGPALRTFTFANSADIVLSVDLDSNSTEWVAYAASRVGAIYPSLGYDRRIVPVTSTSTGICLPPVVDLAFMSHMHIFVTDWPPDVKNPEQYEQELYRFFGTVIEALVPPTPTTPGGRLVVTDAHDHRISRQQALQNYHDLFYPTLGLVSQSPPGRDSNLWEVTYQRQDPSTQADRATYERSFGLAPLDEARRRRAAGESKPIPNLPLPM